MSDLENVAPTVLVIFGATGDLMSRKIVPSLFYLYTKGLWPKELCIVGFSRRGWGDAELRDHVRGILAEKRPEALPSDVDGFLGYFRYFDGHFDEAKVYPALATFLEGIDAQWDTCSNKLFYLAVPPENYRVILDNLSSSGLTEPCSDLTGWTRVLIEKPFGDDEESSKSLDAEVARLFHEEQVYRIDHYLAKEMLQGIMNFRFTNNLFETEWNRAAIERIDVTLLEEIDVGTRGAFYDAVGALRDVGQNHLLQMLALITMEQPESRSPQHVRGARATAMEKLLRPMTRGEAAERTFRAQYDGFREAKGVAPDSMTETYYYLKTQLRGPRWAGVPVSMQAGKAMGDALKQIVVHFRHPVPCLCAGEKHHANSIIFTLEPTESIEIVFWAKHPGFSEEVDKRSFSFFLYEKVEKMQYVEEYARLLHDAFRGDQTLFVSADEIEAGWRFTDPISATWDAGLVPLERYAPGSAEVTERAAQSVESCARCEEKSVGVVGLGKMGAGIARNLLGQGWKVVGFNRHHEVADAMADEGLTPARTLADLVRELNPPRVVWLMVPAGLAVDEMLFGTMTAEGELVDGLADLLQPGDTVIDGGNSYFGDALPRAQRLGLMNIRFLDCGTSGGPEGARNGACLMLGGVPQDFEALEPMFADVAVPSGYALVGPVGAGHFTKMVHNGIEYGMMQAIAEGFALLHNTPYAADLGAVSDLYQHGSVIESRLVGWLCEAYGTYESDLADVSGIVGHTGEGEWTVLAAEEAGVEVPTIAGAVEFRKRSETEPSYTGQVLTALRNAFGGHGVGPAGGPRS